MMALRQRVKQKMAENLLSQALMVLSHSPQGSYRLLAKGFDKIAVTEQHKMIASWLCNWVAEGNPGAPWLSRVLRGLHPNVRKNYIAKTIVDIFFRNPEAFAKYKQEHGFRPPSVMMISPTMRCNYSCRGCYAANYTRDDDLPPELFDRVLNEAKELTTKFCVVLGGEPFIYKPLLDIFERHRDVPFQVYTNGSLIDEKMANRLAKLGNVAPQISIEGFREQTDARRGRGAFDRAMKAMDNLRQAGCIFAFSAMVNRDNVDVLTSDEFIDLMIEKGCLYGWYFLYMPIGDKADLAAMPTPEQRNQLRVAGKHFRETRPILIADFWNDAPLTAGCISGGRSYFHINHKGDVEPCIFVHFATDNIKDVPLVNALNSPFFKALRRMQPFCYNTLRPCPIIDHPKLIRMAIQRYGACPTHKGAESLLTGEIADGLDRYAQEVKELFDPIWDREYAQWAEKWTAAMDFPEGRVETRKAGYQLSRDKNKAPITR
jgi:MoaA/NifB/PqqE/SkfB family radical SAM enzyme